MVANVRWCPVLSILECFSGKPAAPLGTLAGKPIKFRLAMRDADLYSFQFAALDQRAEIR